MRIERLLLGDLELFHPRFAGKSVVILGTLGLSVGLHHSLCTISIPEDLYKQGIKV